MSTTNNNLTCPPDTNLPITGNLSQKGSTSSNQGQEVGHTIDFPLYVYMYIVKKQSRVHYPVKTDPS